MRREIEALSKTSKGECAWKGTRGSDVLQVSGTLGGADETGATGHRKWPGAYGKSSAHSLVGRLRHTPVFQIL